jgi:hypothetical protein
MTTTNPTPFGLAFNALKTLDSKNAPRAAAGLTFAMADVLQALGHSYADVAKMLRLAADKLDTLGEAADEGSAGTLQH